MRARQVTVALRVLEGLESATTRVCPVPSVARFISAALENQTVLPCGAIYQRISPAQKARALLALTWRLDTHGATLVIDPLAPLLPTTDWS